MEGELRLTGLRGSLRWHREGTAAVLEVEAEDREDGLYKVFLRGQDGGELSLGALTPGEGKLRLRRRLPCRELEGSDHWPPVEVRAERVFAFSRPGEWEPAGELPPLLSDPVLRQAAEGVTGALLRRRGEETELAVPFDPGAPFPLVPLICLGRPATVGGRRYLIFRLDAGGRPRPL